MITSHTELSGSLWAFIKTRVRLTDPTASIEPPEPFQEADYYLLASLLQKAIRRGDFLNARRAGHQLYKIAPGRLWYRLMVIALEDIGIGDPEVGIQFIVLSTRPQWREEFGGDLAVLDRLLAEGCASIKDRSGDHVHSLISEGHPEPFPKAPPQASRSVLLTTVASQSLPALTRLDAAVRAADLSNSPKRPPRAKLAGLEALFGIYRDLRCPPLLIDACKAYTQKSSDLLPLVIPLIWALWKERGADPTTQAHVTVSEDIGIGMPSYAFDPIHTRPGKRAVEAWVQAYDALPWSGLQVAAALWNYESAASNQTLTWAEGNKLRNAAYRADLLRVGVPIDQCDDLMEWVRQEYPALAPVRRDLWYRIYRRPYWTETGLKRVNPHLPVPTED